MTPAQDPPIPFMAADAFRFAGTPRLFFTFLPVLTILSPRPLLHSSAPAGKSDFNILHRCFNHETPVSFFNCPLPSSCIPGILPVSTIQSQQPSHQISSCIPPPPGRSGSCAPHPYHPADYTPYRKNEREGWYCRRNDRHFLRHQTS